MLDTFGSALNVHALYHYLVSNYLNPTDLLLKRPTWYAFNYVKAVLYTYPFRRSIIVSDNSKNVGGECT